MFYKSVLKLVVPLKHKQYHSSKLNIKGTIVEELNNKFNNPHVSPFQTYLGLSHLQISSERWYEPDEFTIINVPVTCVVYHSKLELNEPILVKVLEIDERLNLICEYYNLKIYIHHSQYPSANCRIKYVKEVKQLLIDTKTVKPNDVLKIKVIEIGYGKFGILNIRGSIKGLAFGKLAWFKS
jgi:hypothetical protein